MPSRTQLIPAIIGCIFFALLFFALDRVGVLSSIRGGIEVAAQPFQKLLYHGATSLPDTTDAKLQALQKENTTLRLQLAKTKSIEADNKALHDQFASESIPTQHLLPATVIGAPGFLPGITKPETLIIDKGTSDYVSLGLPVIYQNNLLGKVSQVTAHEAEVQLISNKAVAFPAKTQNTDALGVIRGQGNGEMILDNVVLSDMLQKGDTVVTKGDTDSNGSGIIPDLVIGKIIAVNKKASNIFQSAEVASLVDTSRLQTVFVKLHD